MDEFKSNIASKLSKALFELQQILDEYYYYVYKLEVDPKNTGTTRHYRPRKGWIWVQCEEYIKEHPMEQYPLEFLKNLTNQMKQQEKI